MRDQQEWRMAILEKCQAVAPDEPDTGRIMCLSWAYSTRFHTLDHFGQAIGPYLFVTREESAAEKIETEDGEEPDTYGERPGWSTVQLSYPRIDNPKSEAERRFNRFAEQVSRKASVPDTDPSDVTVGYRIHFASPRLISFVVSTSFYGHGAAHGIYDREAFNVRLSDGAPLKPADVFRPGKDWHGRIAQLCRVDIGRQLLEAGRDPEEEIRGVYFEWQNIALSSRSMTIHFDPGAAGAYAIGAFEVTIPYTRVKAYLRATHLFSDRHP